jgi:hypothetical protein
MQGRKDDQDKPMWNLLPLGPIREIVQVLTFGAKKYDADNNWQKVENPTERYFAAMMRHIDAWRAGEHWDPESGLPTLAHAGCCLVFLLWFDAMARGRALKLAGHVINVYRPGQN